MTSDPTWHDAAAAASLVIAAAEPTTTEPVPVEAPTAETSTGMVGVTDDVALVAAVADRLSQFVLVPTAARLAMARSALAAIGEHVGTSGDPATVLLANIHELSGHLDSCLDGLGHTNVSSIQWLNEFPISDEAPREGCTPALTEITATSAGDLLGPFDERCHSADGP